MYFLWEFVISCVLHVCELTAWSQLMLHFQKQTSTTGNSWKSSKILGNNSAILSNDSQERLYLVERGRSSFGHPVWPRHHWIHPIQLHYFVNVQGLCVMQKSLITYLRSFANYFTRLWSPFTRSFKADQLMPGTRNNPRRKNKYQHLHNAIHWDSPRHAATSP